MTTKAAASNALPRRRFGQHDIELSIVGLGGVVVMNETREFAERIVGEAIDRGVNYFDVAPSYGNAEEVLGPALEPYREQVFLACKTTARTADAARRELEQSLWNLRTDRFDLYQLHALSDMAEDVEIALGPGGALEAVVAAQRAGQVRCIGFSAHDEECALAALERFDFDSALFPVNFTARHHADWGRRIVERAEQRGTACLALKALARQPWPDNHPRRADYPKSWYQPAENQRLAELQLRWTLSQPIVAAIPPGVERLFQLAIDVASRYQPLTDAEQAELRAAAEDAAPLFPLSA